jgi:hypothetical protein
MNTATAQQIAWGTDAMTGELRPYYADQAPPATLVPVQQPVQMVAAQRDVWPARLLAGGAAASMVVGVAGSLAPELEQLGHGIQMAGFGVGAALAGLALLKGNAPKVAVNITNSNTGATANSTASAGANAAAGWKNRI